MPITFKTGDILKSECRVLVNPVNCRGVSGKGLAKDFKEAFPYMFRFYQRLCRKDFMHIGQTYTWHGEEKDILLFPTKLIWTMPSEMYYIRNGLNYFVSQCDMWPESAPKSIAFPALGCGLGGLPWYEVKILMTDKLRCLDMHIEIYGPLEIGGEHKTTPADLG